MATGTPPLRAGDLVSIRGERWRVARHIRYDAASIVEADGCDAANRGEHACFLLPFEPLDRLAVSMVPRVVRPARWRRTARQALAAACPPASSLRAATRANLTVIPFQLEPALALAHGDGCRFLLADAVGMGKTVQAGLMAAETLQRRPEARVLVVAPAGLREQWRDELHHRFALDAEVLDAAGVARAAARLPSGVNPWAVHRLVITSIDYVKRPEVIRCHEALIWDLVILDEAHGLAGRSDRAAAADALGSRARALVMLTATPHSGDDEAFNRLCSIGDLNDGHPLVLFRRTRTGAAVAGSRRTSMLRVRPRLAEVLMHQALLEYAAAVWTHSTGARLAMSVLLRRACSSAASLARSVERRIALLAQPFGTPGDHEGRPNAGLVQPGLPFLDAEPADAEPDTVLGVAGLHASQDEQAHLGRLLRLAQDASRAESKLLALRRLLNRVQEPAIVFTEYRDTLQRIASALAHIDVALLHGGMRAQERAEALRRFTSGDARLLLATDAASEGLNLQQRCRLVVNLELPWTPLRLEQRVGRVDRIGQSRRVHALHFVAGGTREETVLATLARRTSRMERTFRAPERFPDEQQVAACAIAGQPLPDPSASQVELARDGIVTPDLRHDAQVEAARLTTARRLITPGDGAHAELRPVLSRFRASHPRTPAPSHPRTLAPSHRSTDLFWLFRIVFIGTDDRVIWESALPLHAGAVGQPDRTNATTRVLLDPNHPSLRHVTDSAMEAQLDSVRHMLRQPLELWRRREHAISRALRARHARLSAGVLQLALFDRRQERTAAAQSALLDEALSASAARLGEIAGCEHPRIDSCQLVFGVALD